LITGTSDDDPSSIAAYVIAKPARKSASPFGTGLTAVPVLAGSAAHAIGETRRSPVGLARRPKEARAFYATLAVATAGGTALNLLAFDPMPAL
jgi:hypothetical protein